MNLMISKFRRTCEDTCCLETHIQWIDFYWNIIKKLIHGINCYNTGNEKECKNYKKNY